MYTPRHGIIVNSIVSGNQDTIPVSGTDVTYIVSGTEVEVEVDIVSGTDLTK